VFLRGAVRLGGSVAGLGLLAGCATPPPAAAPVRVYRVGLLVPTADPDPSVLTVPFAFFWERLAELGYVEGQNLVKPSRGAGRCISAR
jgi:hypothetical protein